MPETPEKQLAKFISKYTPAVAKEGRAALKAMQRLVPGATRLVCGRLVIKSISAKQRPRRPG